MLYRSESILKISTHYLGTDQADGGLYVWLFKSNLKDLWELSWFNTRAFYPYTLSLAWSDNFILPSIIAKPFIHLGLPIIIAYNLILLVASFLNGFLTFKIAYQLSNHFLGALIAGTIFLGFPFLVLHLGHPQLQFAFWIPLVFILYFKYFHQPKLITAILLGFTLFLSFLTTVYYTIFLLVALLITTLGFIIYQRSFFKLNQISKAIIGFLIGLTPILPFALPYLEVKETFGTRNLISTRAFGADLISYFSAPNSHLLFNFTSEWSHNEALLFPSLASILALLIIAISLQAKKPKRLLILSLGLFIIAGTFQIFEIRLGVWLYWIIFFLLLFYIYQIGKLSRKLKVDYVSNQGLVACLLFICYSLFFWSLGPLGIGENFVDDYIYPQGIHSIFYHFLPGVSAIRAVSRMGILVVFFLTLLIPFAFQSLKRNKLFSKALIPIFLLSWTILENYPKYYPLENEHPALGLFTTLSEYVEHNDAVIALPMTSENLSTKDIKTWSLYSKTSINYQNWLINHPVQLVNGYSGQHSRNAYLLPAIMQNFPNQESLQQLGLICNLKWIIYASSNQPNFNREKFEASLNNYSDRLEIVANDSFGNYLIKFSNITPLNPETYLQVPSYPINQALSFDLKANTIDQKAVTVALYVKKYGDTLPWKYLNLIADNTWQRFTVNIPITPDSVRPVFIRFESETDLTLGENKLVDNDSPIDNDLK